MHRQTTRTVAKTNAGDAAKRNCTQRQRRQFATASCLLLPFPILFLVLAGNVVVVVSVDDDASMASACLPLCIVLGAHALCLFILPPKAVLDELSWGSDWGRGLWLWGGYGLAFAVGSTDSRPGGQMPLMLPLPVA